MLPARFRKLALLLSLCAALTGCSATPVIHPQAANDTIFLPGVGGDTPVYANAIDALRDAGDPDRLEILNWGYGWLLFFVTINDGPLHHDTEKKLVAEIMQWRSAHPGSRIVLIGHSAGAGVILGALARLDPGVVVGPVVLLAPAVSPEYDLRPILAHVTVVHVFYSEADSFWQGFGPTIFGLYDGDHGDGAGRKGFELRGLTEIQKRQIVQHPYDPKWKALGNDGGHFDSCDPKFVAKVIRPLIQAP